MEVSTARTRWLVLSSWLCASHAAAAPAAPATGRSVAVARFAGDSAAGARAAILDVLSNHRDIAVVALDDITFASQRFKLDLGSSEGRRKLSEELHVDLWIDGERSADGVRVRLSTPDGEVLEQADAPAGASGALDELAAERMWASMGGLLSPDEERSRQLQAREAIARQKLAAREQERLRQRELVEARAQARDDRLKAHWQLGVHKREERTREAARQIEVAHAHKAELLAEEQRRKAAAAEAARRAEEERRQAEIAAKEAARKRDEEQRAAEQAAADAARRREEERRAAERAASVAARRAEEERKLAARAAVEAARERERARRAAEIEAAAVARRQAQERRAAEIAAAAAAREEERERREAQAAAEIAARKRAEEERAADARARKEAKLFAAATARREAQEQLAAARDAREPVDLDLTQTPLEPAPARTSPFAATQTQAPDRPSESSNLGVSPATQRWLMQQGYTVSVVPIARGPARTLAADSGAVTPATRRWLMQQQEQQQR